MTDEPMSAATTGDLASRGTAQSMALGFETLEGVCAMRAPFRPDLVGDPAEGGLAGGVITTLLDHTCGLAIKAAAFDFSATATLDLRIDYMRAAEPGRAVIARAHCYKLTHTIAFVRASAYEDDPEDPVATAQGAFVLSGAPA